MKCIIRNLKNLFKKNDKPVEECGFVKGLTEKQLQDLFLEYPELKKNAIVFGSKEILEKYINVNINYSTINRMF